MKELKAEIFFFSAFFVPTRMRKKRVRLGIFDFCNTNVLVVQNVRVKVESRKLKLFFSKKFESKTKLLFSRSKVGSRQKQKLCNTRDG